MLHGKQEVASANKLAFEDNPHASSFVYIKNSNSAGIKPCGTPTLTLIHIQTYTFKTTLFSVSQKNNIKLARSAILL